MGQEIKLLILSNVPLFRMFMAVLVFLLSLRWKIVMVRSCHNQYGSLGQMYGIYKEIAGLLCNWKRKYVDLNLMGLFDTDIFVLVLTLSVQ